MKKLSLRFGYKFMIQVIESMSEQPENINYKEYIADIANRTRCIKENEHFSAGLMADMLNAILRDNLDQHQYKGEYHPDCPQCNKCRITRTIATETHQPQIILAVHGPTPRRGHRAYVNTTEGRLPFGDTDMRVRGQVRKGKSW